MCLCPGPALVHLNQPVSFLLTAIVPTSLLSRSFRTAPQNTQSNIIIVFGLDFQWSHSSRHELFEKNTLWTWRHAGKRIRKKEKTHEFKWGSVAAMVAKSCNKSDTAKSSQQVQLALSYSSALWHQQCAQSSLSLSLSLSVSLSLSLSPSLSLSISISISQSISLCLVLPVFSQAGAETPPLQGQQRENLGCPSGLTLEHKGRVKWRGWSPVRDTRVEYSWADENAVKNQPVLDAESHCKLQQKEHIKE